MSKRLQVLLDEAEFKALRAVSAREHLTVSEWVRQAIQTARRQRPGASPDRKIAVIRTAAKHQYPTADIDQMLTEIEHGYGHGTGR